MHGAPKEFYISITFNFINCKQSVTILDVTISRYKYYYFFKTEEHLKITVEKKIGIIFFFRIFPGEADFNMGGSTGELSEELVK